MFLSSFDLFEIKKKKKKYLTEFSTPKWEDFAISEGSLNIVSEIFSWEQKKNIYFFKNKKFHWLSSNFFFFGFWTEEPKNDRIFDNTKMEGLCNMRGKSEYSQWDISWEQKKKHLFLQNTKNLADYPCTFFFFWFLIWTTKKMTEFSTTQKWKDFAIWEGRPNIVSEIFRESKKKSIYFFKNKKSH